MELAKCYEVFQAQAKVAIKAVINFGGNSLVSLSYIKEDEKDPTLTPEPVWRDPMFKIEPGLTEAEYLKFFNWDTHFNYGTMNIKTP